jgi:hypothetical protein
MGKNFRNRLEYKNYSEHKKGQIEMFGLAVIVILISLGFFIFVSFKSQQNPDNPQKEFTNDKMANDFVLSILDVSVQGCEEFSVKDLIIDCSRDHRLECNGRKSCIAVNESINIMLNRTFMAREMKFRFYSEGLLAYLDDAGTVRGELFNILYRNCTPSSNQGRASPAVISTYPAPTVYLYLNICYQ